MLNRLKKLDTLQRAAIVSLLFVLFCSFAGMTEAWYTGANQVINRFAGHEYYVDIEIIEPNWDSTGKAQAMAVQPGMDIFKDPRTVNTSEDECIVRMRVEILDSSGNAIVGDRYDALYDAIGTYNGSSIDTGFNTDNFTELNGWYYYTGGTDYCKQLSAGEATEPLFTDVTIPILKTDYIGSFDEGFTLNVIAEAVFSVSDSYTVEMAEARFGSDVATLSDELTSSTALGEGVIAVSRTFSSATFVADASTSGTAVGREG